MVVVSFGSTRVVPKLVIILFRRTCNAIYQNSNDALVFWSSLSFHQAFPDASTSNRSWVKAGFVKTVARTPLENEMCKKKQTKKCQCAIMLHKLYLSLPATASTITTLLDEQLTIQFLHDKVTSSENRDSQTCIRVNAPRSSTPYNQPLSTSWSSIGSFS